MYGDDVLIVDYLIDEIEAGYNQTIAQECHNAGDPNGYGLAASSTRMSKKP